MVTVERRIPVGRPAEEVLRYLADFAHTAEWDPGTVRCVRTGTGPVTEGSRWTNTSRFRGRTTQLEYRLVRRDAERLLFVGENRTVTAIDDITVRPAAGGGAVVDYRAQLRFKGMARLAAPFLKGAFEDLADGVAARLPQVLAAPVADR
ncbi:SRPBCC family protein [Kitasatospora sp. DSM 101779]|uniref:SRPBCC family protein n=1 Tax=Kitasatospora sp. DSM 101779 TaxID=2853165 RepID=UPI0021D8C5CE|nr:SRPBCC family protein [Kitasatospora sp. DSM 101779]MCU7826936.1 SRPBCC family protein [Kitasatospora sp. DSM 101779]